MSTPEEQQQQRQQRQAAEQDPYSTQTWQADTWETGYQPVQPPLGSVPGQPAPAPAPQGQWGQTGGGGVPWPDATGGGAGSPAAAETAYLPPVPAQQQPAAPEGWFRDEQPPAPAQGGWSADAAAQTAYLPPVPAQQAPQPQAPQQQAVPDGWFRDEPAQAPQPQPQAPSVPWPDATGGGAAVSAAAETAYLPPVREPAGAAEQTAYLPPVRPHAPAPGDAWAADADAAAQTAYLPPVREPAAEQTAYLPPVPSEPQAQQPQAAVPGPSAEYSPPTLGGNTLRAVDPAQARAEGRSPIIDPGPQSAILTAALGLLMAGAAAVGQWALLVPLIALQGLTAAGWFRLNGMWPARQGIVLAFAGALVADGAVLALDRTYAPGAVIGTLGAWVLLTLVLQLRSHADPDERMYGLMASVASAALAIVCTGFLAADWEPVATGAAAVAVAVFARALPLPTPASVGVSLAAAAGAGIAVGGLTGLGAGGALVGLAAGVCALIGLRVAAYDYPSKFVHMTAGVALPLAAAAPVVYLMGRVVG
ncbi:hypothetical protein QEZ40_004756 [Streptomyces katrae]|uniref:Integral membrane protein n=1 Tax=Streptomyces katrae TaxID=68223 RepID=A0ABT7H1G9_9ACTN|nr:hypothetical protein [Streptomyces katrae]MDK9499336.1 hypothetical protein [Streptomyces katrae]